ncbi:Hypothetical predicted protein [Marmota monax]|uniref:Uncharacterized protein n=1 Tax=Marmota monax TaxID=9995 RepID=A0A5E4BJ81_MARMO|nr:Hypothetical predicted protein [Marmota monax]
MVLIFKKIHGKKALGPGHLGEQEDLEQAWRCSEQWLTLMSWPQALPGPLVFNERLVFGEGGQDGRQPMVAPWLAFSVGCGRDKTKCMCPTPILLSFPAEPQLYWRLLAR